MSSWTYLNGIIKIDGIKKAGIIKVFDLKENIDLKELEQLIKKIKKL